MRRFVAGLAMLVGMAGTAGAQTNLINHSGVWTTNDTDRCVPPVWTSLGPGPFDAVLYTTGINCVSTFTQPLTFSGPVTGTFSFGYMFYPNTEVWELPHFQPMPTIAWGDCSAVVPMDTVMVHGYPVLQQSSTTCTTSTSPSSLTFAVTVPLLSTLHVYDVAFTATAAPEPSSLALLATGLIPLVPLVRRRARRASHSPGCRRRASPYRSGS